jgi:hypothetical protein
MVYNKALTSQATFGTTDVLTNFKSDLLLSTNNKKGGYVK